MNTQIVNVDANIDAASQYCSSEEIWKSHVMQLNLGAFGFLLCSPPVNSFQCLPAIRGCHGKEIYGIKKVANKVFLRCETLLWLRTCEAILVCRTSGIPWLLIVPQLDTPPTPFDLPEVQAALRDCERRTVVWNDFSLYCYGTSCGSTRAELANTISCLGKQSHSRNLPEEHSECVGLYYTAKLKGDSVEDSVCLGGLRRASLSLKLLPTLVPAGLRVRLSLLRVIQKHPVLIDQCCTSIGRESEGPSPELVTVCRKAMMHALGVVEISD
eukprot:6492480-Amphidinium_carterae.1